MQYLGYTLEDYQGEEYPLTPHTPRRGTQWRSLMFLAKRARYKPSSRLKRPPRRPRARRSKGVNQQHGG